MTEDRIELVDREYGQCATVNPSRQIKTRSTSFGNIRDRFMKFRLRRLQKKLEKKVESALTEGYTSENYESKITKNANIIAKLEEKIMVLSKEEVPTNYVAKRAIKLRKNMIANLTYNSGSMYTVGLEHRDEIMAKEEPEEIPTPIEVKEEPEPISVEDLPRDAVLAAAIPNGNPDKEIDVVPSDLERQAIVDVVNSSFDDIKEDEQTTDEPKEAIGSDEVREVIEEAMDKAEGKEAEAEPVAEETPASETVDREAVRGVIDEAFDAMEKQDAAPVVEEPVVEEPVVEQAHEVEAPVTAEEAQQVQAEVDKAIEKIRVSRNNASQANVSRYDENGYRRERRRKYNYTPMTDEEVRQAQIKLGFDEHGNLIDNGARPKETISSAKIVGSYIAPGSIPNVTIQDAFVPASTQIREVPIVAPDRDAKDKDLDLDDGKSMFEIVDQEAQTPAEPQVEVPTGSMTSADYAELKNKIIYLQQQKLLTQKKKQEAQKAAEEAEAQAQEARRQYEISQASYNERMEKLRALAAAMEADCSENERSAEQAEEAARRSHDYSEEQRNLADENNRIIGEIDSMIGEQEPAQTTAIAVRK